MAKVTFITLYDQYSLGVRIMSSMLRNAGHECNIIYSWGNNENGQCGTNYFDKYPVSNKPALNRQ